MSRDIPNRGGHGGSCNRTDDVGKDVVLATFDSQSLGQANDARLCGGILSVVHVSFQL